MNNLTPTRKVGAGAVAGAISILLVWGLQQAGVSLPAEIASSLTTILTFVTSWFVPEGE